MFGCVEFKRLCLPFWGIHKAREFDQLRRVYARCNGNNGGILAYSKFLIHFWRGPPSSVVRAVDHEGEYRYLWTNLCRLQAWECMSIAGDRGGSVGAWMALGPGWLDECDRRLAAWIQHNMSVRRTVHTHIALFIETIGLKVDPKRIHRLSCHSVGDRVYEGLCVTERSHQS